MAVETWPVHSRSRGPIGAYARRNALFRLGIVALFVAAFILIRGLKLILWGSDGRPASGLLDMVMVYGSVIWVVLLPWAVSDLAGWMLYRRHSAASDGIVGPAIDHHVCFRVVTVGDQPDVVVGTVESVLVCMRARPLFPFSIEVVTDTPIVGLPDETAITELVVPVEFTTPLGARHKARALHYAVETSRLPRDAWIMHLDEETRPTLQVIEGIRSAVAEEEASGELRIGQGLILYHRSLERNTVLTLADSVRVADDMGRFTLQYRLNRVLFGMHGSFVLVRNDVERRIGWDMTPEDSVTEDTTWSLLQMERGAGFRSVDGHMIEQSPLTASDFLRQRGRWFRGMWWSALHTDAALRHRIMLIVAMCVWSVGWMMLLYTYLHLFSGVAVPAGIAVVGDVIFAVYLTNYLLGLWISLSDRGAPWPDWVRYSFLQLVLLPWYTALEAFAVIHAVIRPHRGFAVVKK